MTFVIFNSDKSSLRFQFQLAILVTGGGLDAEADHNKKFFQGKTVLEDISFQMTQGDSLVMLGANGAEKCTLLKIIMKMLGEDDGKIEWSQKKPRISYVPHRLPSLAI
ncbi:ABC transporter [Terribacillus aidingensis]|uniref:ABC transporter n=1 Tax=Terribacillus aidingensis TaxID=586416 RepID=A0A285NJM1_9BACI|nr:ATP-binding cassette domain-containing protein [Terribacillus aidingensis]SNZ09123.1 ABC transporter [Terribacillus aidingensis]